MHLIQKKYRWPVVIGGGILLVIVAVNEIEPFSSLGGGFYVLLLLYWGIQELRLLLQLRNQQVETELLHLKSQINPHFFFNTLNNLYGWVAKDPKTAQALILKLSEMMRYSIYQGNKKWVPLQEEVDYLRNYVDLHQIRYHKKTEVIFNVELAEENGKVMPLLFIILLENAFKHGVEKLTDHAYVHLDLINKDNQVQFTVENSFDPSEQELEPGIGLQNLQRRLELAYPDHHELSFGATDNVFQAHLTIPLL